MSSLNKVMILGRLTKDPEMKNLPSGKFVTNMSVATSKKWNDKATGEAQEKSEFHSITVFGKQAENANKYLAKGRQVFIEGELQTEKWQDKDGNNRYTTKVIASNVTFIGSNAQQNDALKTASKKKKKQFEVSTDTQFASEDIPF